MVLEKQLLMVFGVITIGWSGSGGGGLYGGGSGATVKVDYYGTATVSKGLDGSFGKGGSARGWGTNNNARNNC